MAAETLAKNGVAVTVHDRMPSVGRKFLMAGIGGLNLTHTEAWESFTARYRSEGDWLSHALHGFPPNALRDWCAALGEETFIGSSGRVFPKSFKASPLLRTWLGRLDGLGVRIQTRCRWLGWEREALRFETVDGVETAMPDMTVLALGGASWPRLGSDGEWVAALMREGVEVVPLRPSNCGFVVRWGETFRERYAGHPLKSVRLSAEGVSVSGEALITSTGIEGGAIYALSPVLREKIAAFGEATLFLDFKPSWNVEKLASRLRSGRSGDSLANRLRKAGRFPPVVAAFCRELGGVPKDALTLAKLLKALPLRLTDTTPIGRAISTAGGVAASALDARMMLRARPGTFVAGEMLDWEAPTGGYLLQACFASGRAAALGALDWFSSKSR